VAVMVSYPNSLLLVEDSEDDEFLSLRAVKNSGVPCSVQVIRHGDNVLQQLLEEGTRVPNLIVLDFHLPGLNGLEILRQIRANERTRFIPVVMLSGLASDEQLVNCLDQGANSCVIKPVDSAMYVEQVALIIRYWFTVDKRPEHLPTQR
jgi:two-component system, response regulator